MKKSISDQEHVAYYAQAIKNAREESDEKFHAWFDDSKNVHQTLVRGSWDFSCHILTEIVCSHLKDPEEKTCLEIGYGGGRILSAASNFFKEAIGIDIHDEAEAVKNFLHLQGVQNVRLIRSSGRTIDVDTESIDFIYSFIVLQHLPTFESFLGYLGEIYRCCKKGGVVQIYYGGWNHISRQEKIIHSRNGYKELTSPDITDYATTTLVVKSSKVKKVCLDMGFTVLDSGHSWKKVPNGYLKQKGGQSYITLLKP